MFVWHQIWRRSVYRLLAVQQQETGCLGDPGRFVRRGFGICTSICLGVGDPLILMRLFDLLFEF